ncbi:glycosyltransferase [Flavobacterium johnsoniae]|uniref:Glycosyltransferase involved in cell wall bisynthesis n=1 Tax=Flavobacterium johnsoniae TaxID=986 RepID=A0A1M5L3Y1_FLAJO|nr:glycosyltransferase [Flavobacterium johnsoniae]SHG59711.1 Glycosyltransferase involved in cell wall bisynthesis [Flavobacterium johnsoniae]
MKVLQIINNLSTGGAEKLILETIPLFRKKGVEADLLVLDDTKYPYMKELEALKCCTIISTGKRSLYNPLLIFKIIPYLKKYDLIHVHLFPAQYWTIIAKIISFSKTKIIFTEHNTFNRRMQNFFFKKIDKNIYRFYDKIICITKEVKEVMLKHCEFKSKDIFVIENGVNLDSIIKASPMLREEIDRRILESDKLLIQVAGFRAQKDQKTVIRSLQYLDLSVKLLLVGDGIFRKECENLVVELGLKERVFFLGIRIDVPNLIKMADISVVSSHWEGFGLVAVESMAAGKPVIASNVEGLSNVVEGAGILFEKGNDIELASKIKKVLNNSVYNQLVNLGLKRAEKYNITNMVDLHIDMYKSLLE